MNGTQLYGLRRLAATLRMSRHPGVRRLSWRQKLALNHVNRHGKLTELDGRIYSNTFTPYYPSTAYDRFIDGLVRMTSGDPVPVVANFAVTARCCCDCWHCSFSERSPRSQLSLEQLRDSIAQLQDMGTSVIGLTGGEPLLRDDLEEILAAIDDRSMPLLFTTGFGLTPQRVRALKDAGLGIPVLSLDHHVAARHDRGRGVDGIFDQTVAAIRMFQDEGFYVAVSFVPDRYLVADPEQIDRILAFFVELGIHDMRLTSPILAGHLVDRPDQLLDAQGVRTVHDIQRRCVDTPGHPGVFAYDFFEGRDQYGCGAGLNYLFIDSLGNACPCDFAMMSFGNVTERPIAEIFSAMNGQFRYPGTSCYANRCASTLAARKPGSWPVDTATALEILRDCPPYDPQDLPEFYRRFGFQPCPEPRR